MTTYMGTKDNIFKTFLISILGNIKYFFTCLFRKKIQILKLALNNYLDTI